MKLLSVIKLTMQIRFWR